MLAKYDEKAAIEMLNDQYNIESRNVFENRLVMRGNFMIDDVK